MTGESLPVRKETESLFDAETGPGDRLNVAYSSSTVTKGRAKGVVFATGVYTEIGAIAAQLRQKDSKVRPVKKRGPNGRKAWVVMNFSEEDAPINLPRQHGRFVLSNMSSSADSLADRLRPWEGRVYIAS